jgi:ERCC4-related helicase/ERCC4-type nuclease
MATTDEVARIDHPLLTPGFLERRLYQLQLAGTARTGHTLVCLPTGLGKTTVSLLVTAERLYDVGGKSLLLAPTKPLVQQHADFYREALQIPDDEIVVFTGEVKPDDRAELWDSAQIVIATPQVVENDLVGNRVSLRDVTHITFDECHRASGDYAYVYIAERYHEDAENPLVTGMSASPGGDEEEILDVCENLGLHKVEVMTEDDADVAEFTHDTEVQWEEVDLPEEILAMRELLNEVIKERLEALKELGVTNTTQPDLSQKKLNRMRAELRKLINNDQSEGYQGMSIHAEVMKLRRAVELVETQSVESVRRYFDRQREDARSSGASKASQRLVSDPRVRQAMRKAETFDGLHPKFSKTRILLAETLGIGDGERVIVFTESRDTAEALTEFLSQSFTTQRFVGQGDKDGSDGMTQKQQQETLDRFRAGEFEVLVSTSVAEEGLDVPEVDLVLFYEPVPTAIRSIQRKGRTGRQAKGKVVVLMASDTRDEAFFWISRRREKEMENELRALKGLASEMADELDDSQKSLAEFDAPKNGAGGSSTAKAETKAETETTTEAREAVQPGLTDYDERTDDDANAAESANGDDADADTDEPEGVVAQARSADDEDVVEIVVDQRELDSPIAKELSRREGVRTRLETLQVGDYVLSDRVAVERKSVSDFLDTLTGGDRSMFEQVGDLARAYARPVVILEGGNLYDERNVHPNAIRGALASLAIDFDASVLRTEDADDTADMLEVIATREQRTSERTVSVHGEKGGKTLTEQQEYVVGSVADIGPVTARALLEHFGTVEAVMTAKKEDLLEVKGVGEVTADRLREVVGGEYE